MSRPSELRRPRDAARRRRVTALGLSLLGHGSFLLLVIATLRGGAISSGGGDPEGEVGAINVTLAGLKGGAQPAAADPAQEALAAMFRKATAEPSDLVASDEKPRPQTDLAKLFDAPSQQQSGKTEGATGAGRSQLDKGGQGATSNGAPKATAERRAATNPVRTAGAAGASLSTGDLWGQIKPCWNGLPAVATVPVTLSVTLNKQGRISAPPKIVRTSSAAPDEIRLISESRALAALAACVPYHALGFLDGPRVFEVKFGSAK